MRQGRLGGTALEVSVLGFGSSPFGNVYADFTQAQAERVVDAALNCGVNFFDSSPYYGITVAEERLGAALAGKREKAVLATKCGRYGLEEFDFSRGRIRRSVEESLKRLRTDYLDLLQAHDVEFTHERQIVEETIPALRELQREGKCRYIGITGYPVKLLRRIAEAAPVDTVLSYCRYALLNTDMEEVLAPMAERGVGLINASALMMGVLTEQGAPAWHRASPELQAAGQRAAVAAREHGGDIVTLALQFSLDQEFAASTLVGMSTPEEVLRNVRAAEKPIDRDLLTTVQQAVGGGFPTTWASDLPEHDESMGHGAGCPIPRKALGPAYS